MGSEYNLISQDAQRALEEFKQDFAMALAQGPVDSWAREMGLYSASRALKTTYPVPVHAALYEEFKGDMKYRSLFEKSIELIPKTWQDGVAELASIIEAPDFIGWGEQPAAMAFAAASLENEIIAAALEAGTSTTGWDGETFFDTDHPVNVFDLAIGTDWSNYITTSATFGVTNLALAKKMFRALKGPNNKPLGLRMTHLMVPGALEETARDLLERDMIIESSIAMPNRHAGTVKLIVADELTSDIAFYAFALNKPGMKPWIVQTEGSPEVIVQDKSSHLYASTLKVGLSSILRGNGGLAMPHCVIKFDGD